MSVELVNRLLTSAFFVALLSALVLYLGQTYPVSMMVDLASAGTFAVAMFMHRRLTVGQRLLVLVLGGLAIASAAMVSNPYARDAYLVMAAVMVLGFTHWTGWRAWLLPIVLVSTLFAVSASVMQKWISIDFNAVRVGANRILATCAN